MNCLIFTEPFVTCIHSALHLLRKHPLAFYFGITANIAYIYIGFLKSRLVETIIFCIFEPRFLPVVSHCLK